MKFKPNEDFRHGRNTFEAGNSYDPERYGIPEDEVKRFWESGWAEVDGWDKAPERDTRGKTVNAHKGSVGHKGQKA